MKKALMLLLVACGFLTAVYRFLPDEHQQGVREHISSVAPGAMPRAEAEPPPKYRLHIPDLSATAQQNPPASPEKASAAENAVNGRERLGYLPVAGAYLQGLHDVQVQGEGRVVKMLPDDNEGSRHQRFVVRTSEDVSVLIAHNIDLASRIANLQLGDQVGFFGEYVWNDEGGIVHWTHRDPRGEHLHGWLKHEGATYQ
jgi:hypothetical protein